MLSVIERALINSNIGLAPNNNGEVIRLIIPPLTEERRRDLAKQCKAEAENAKVSVRNARRDAIETLKKQVKEGLPEDAEKDAEGLQTMRTLARNMVFLMRGIALAKEKYGLPEKEPWQGTHFIRE